MKKELSPFVKWAGGKRQLLDKIKSKQPLKYGKYIEPFVGGGAVLFGIQPNKAIINDININLVNTYRVIRDNTDALLKHIAILDEGIKSLEKEYFYYARDRYNNKIIAEKYDCEAAALFIFLNKHCFNGLYRVNRKGLFNVPYNNSVRDSVDSNNIYAVSDFLKNIDIRQGDFERVCSEAEKGDFVFFDSPYAPLKDDSFEAYTKEGFDKESHIRLANLYKALSKKGCYCMLTNHNTNFINDLYNDFNIEVVPVKRMINRDANNRVGEEVIVTNY